MVADPRLSRRECQRIADEFIESLGDITGADALRRFGRSHVDEVVTDERTGKPYRRIVWATPAGDERVMLGVSVDPEPQRVRHARRARIFAELIEGWQSAAEGGSSNKLVPR